MSHLVPQETLATLAHLSDELARLADAANPLVVTVHGRRRWPSTGIVWRDGLIVTAAHTLRRQAELVVTLANGQEIQATVLGIDPATDLAVLKAPDAAAVSYETADPAAIGVGSLGLVVSRRAGGATAATLAMVRIAGGAWRTRGGATLQRFVVLAMAPYFGLSGSPYLTATGAVAGILTMGLGRVGPVLVPGPDVTRVVDEIAAKGRVAIPYLGIAMQSVRLPDKIVGRLALDRPDGILVTGTQADGPADAAGWIVGDVLVELAGESVGDLEDLRAAVSAERIGQSVPARVVRGGELQTLPIRVGERPRLRC